MIEQKPEDVAEPNENEFHKFSFLIRRSDILKTRVPQVWSIENHILIAKWVATEVPDQFQITNRYNLWNSCETSRYIHLKVADSKIRAARDTGFVFMDSQYLKRALFE
ncbi:unnamed protein product [Caenorhabditis sp. 36 PRJEB53466]|nr:unnamed protein product [Caenorhabditis sp. 36 PRJEB53466]